MSLDGGQIVIWKDNIIFENKHVDHDYAANSFKREHFKQDHLWEVFVSERFNIDAGNGWFSFKLFATAVKLMESVFELTPDNRTILNSESVFK